MFANLEMLPILRILSGVAPIVTQFVEKLMVEHAEELPTREDLSFEIGLALCAVKSPKIAGCEIVEDADRKNLALFLAGIILNTVRAKRGLDIVSNAKDDSEAACTA